MHCSGRLRPVAGRTIGRVSLSSLDSFVGATRCNMSIVSSYFLSAEQIAVELDVESRNEDQWKGSPV